MSAKRRRPSREIHDAFENDIDLDLSAETIVGGESDRDREAGPVSDEARRELIERVKPSEMIPDRFQPRPILPLDIQRRLFHGELDCYESAAAWLELAQEDRGHRDRVEELMLMADSVKQHGQIKPITGAWVTAEDGSYLFRIETGERRFWGACLRAVKEGFEEEPLLRVEAVDNPSVERQIVENRHAQPPNAVAQAREISALLLSEMGMKPGPETEDPYDYFRQALDPPGRERLPRGVWAKIEPVMQLTPRRMQQILALLKMPTDLLELADRYDLSDRVLQAIMAEPEEDWPKLTEAAVEGSLTGAEVSAVARQAALGAMERERRPRQRDHARSALRGLRGFTGAVARAGGNRREEVLDSVADEIIVQENAVTVLGVLEELVSMVRARIQAMEEIEGRG